MTDSSEQHDARAMLFKIALSTHLPTPTLIHLDDAGRMVSLSFDTIAKADAWAESFHCRASSFVLEGRRYANHERVTWFDWSLQIHASEPAEMADRS